MACQLMADYVAAMLEALSILGYGTSFESREMLRRGVSDFCAQGFRAKYEGGRRFGIEQFESLWGEYRTISGEPAYMFAAEAIELYPDAKVVLTVRDDEEKWLTSLCDTMWYGRTRWSAIFLRYVDAMHAKLHKLTDPYWKYLFDDDVPNQAIRVYREHNAMVKRLAAGRVLVYNTKEGWEPLCKFLDKEVPSSDFPHVNKTDEHRNLFATARRQALIGFGKRLLVQGALPSMLAGLVLWKKANIGTLLNNLRSS